MRLIATFGLAGILTSACAPTQAPAPGGPAGPAQCDAEASKSLIGSHRGAVTFVEGANVRFVCTTCAETKDYRADRLNIRYEEATGIIRSVDCG